MSPMPKLPHVRRSENGLEHISLTSTVFRVLSHEGRVVLAMSKPGNRNMIRLALEPDDARHLADLLLKRIEMVRSEQEEAGSSEANSGHKSGHESDNGSDHA